MSVIEKAEEFIKKIEEAKKKGVEEVLLIGVYGSLYEYNLKDWGNPTVNGTTIIYEIKQGGNVTISHLFVKYIFDVKTSIIV